MTTRFHHLSTTSEETATYFLSQLQAMKEEQRQHSIALTNMLTRIITSSFDELKNELKSEIAISQGKVYTNGLALIILAQFPLFFCQPPPFVSPLVCHPPSFPTPSFMFVYLCICYSLSHTQTRRLKRQ